MGYVRRYLQGSVMELRNLLEENVRSGCLAKEFQRDTSLLEELDFWLRDEEADETKMDEQQEHSQTEE